MLTAVTRPAKSEEERAKPFVDPLEEVLSIGPEALAMKMGIPSEALMDRAARLWATAKRVETEGRVAKRSVRRVRVLAVWRSALDSWQDLQLEIVYMDAGGGTMWTHMMSRNDVDLEKFLAGVAEQLPLEGKEPDAVTSKALEGLLTASLAWLDEIAKRDRRIKLRPEQVTSIRQELRSSHDGLRRALALGGNAETAAKMLRYCWEADAVKLIKLGEG